MDDLARFSPPEETSSSRPVIIAAVVVVIVGVLIFLLSRGAQKPGDAAAPVPAYAGNLQIGDLHLSAAENFVGGNVTYVEGKLTNTGDKLVTGVQVEVIFRNMLGEVVDKQKPPLHVSASPLGNPDWVALSVSPLSPGKFASFRLTFEHVSADWNQGYPELKIIGVSTK